MNTGSNVGSDPADLQKQLLSAGGSGLNLDGLAVALGYPDYATMQGYGFTQQQVIDAASESITNENAILVSLYRFLDNGGSPIAGDFNGSFSTPIQGSPNFFTFTGGLITNAYSGG